ncbi:4-hydroxybenzoate 3-monooxygenase [Actinokineospora cianjurensis]|uniref:p-hydroxybenzoate 3-monooxygenase n=1 Tax=Actinokineospora cianjurensis TaxID=585224 RepID=A0A421B1K5_9PSEU|nr:4-hydroxybenzoate 3-monooxygenase [Actinokineospora cianjurensis]RLK58240.1 p-hydroxybenzoate 3-monooxygenase [Actinokineospora cianjurensis]
MSLLVGIVGAGPAGLLLGRLLQRAGIDSVVFESRDRGYVERRQRAGILEQGTVDTLRAAGAADRLDREGIPHDGIDLVFDGAAHRVDFLGTTGARVWIHAQTEVVKDLVALRLDDGLPLLFDTEVRAVTDLDGRPTVHHDGGSLVCDYVVGCDGFHGVTRGLVPGPVHERAFPYSWLGILADAPPVHHELVYAHSRRGFALASMRSPSVSRLYLQVLNGESPDAWPDSRIWTELEHRLADHRPHRGPITAKSVLPMRASVAENLRNGPLFLAGDAAHIVPPTGAKGLNLAASDVTLLAAAFDQLNRTGSPALLDAYEDTALHRVWRAQHFSHFMTTTLHLAPDQSEFDTHLQLARLRHLTSSRAATTALAENYTGIAL